MVHLYHGSVLPRKSHRSFFHRYKNVVTGSIRADAPPLCLGGLLADVRSFSHHTPFALFRQAYTCAGYGIGENIDDTGLDHELH